MSKINTYELQSQVYAKLKQGATAAELWDKEYRTEKLRQELRHLIGDGNPSTKDYNAQVRGMLDSTENNIKQGEDIGVLAAAEYTLTMLSVALAGSVLRSLVSVEPKTIPEAQALLKDYQALSQGITEATLSAAIGHLPESSQEVYQVDVVRLYGGDLAPEAGDGVAGD